MGRPDVRAHVLAWFAAKGAVPGETEAQKLAVDYFAAGLLDSLGVVGLVSELEGRFAVRFADKHYQQPRFSTIGGLCEIVSELADGRPAP